MSTRKLITWGAHPSHGATWIKLHRFSRAQNASRLRQGWELAFLPVGEAPHYPPVESAVIRALCRCTITDADRRAFASIEKPAVSPALDR